MQKNNFILDGFVWSFSRVSSFTICQYCFWLQYIQGKRGIDSFFGQYGSFVHDLLERYNKGELFAFELAYEYENRYAENVTKKVSDKISENYYNQGHEFFKNFEEPDYEVLCCEQEYLFKVGEYQFTGKVDVETSDAIVDYKTKSSKAYKRKPKDKNVRQLHDGRYVDLDEFIQLYIYCIPYKEKYGKFPDKLILEMVKIGDRYVLDFNKDDFDWCVAYIIYQIESIYNTVEFTKTESEFWCNQICGQRFNCKGVE